MKHRTRAVPFLRDDIRRRQDEASGQSVDVCVVVRTRLHQVGTCIAIHTSGKHDYCHRVCH